MKRPMLKEEGNQIANYVKERNKSILINVFLPGDGI